jgi:hypothetical protein
MVAAIATPVVTGADGTGRLAAAGRADSWR